MIRSAQLRNFETLEKRQVLSGHGLAPGLLVAAQHANAHSHVPVLISSTMAGVATATHTVLNAVLTDATDASITGAAHFSSVTKHGATTTKFSASIEGAAPNT